MTEEWHVGDAYVDDNNQPYVTTGIMYHWKMVDNEYMTEEEILQWQLEQ